MSAYEQGEGTLEELAERFMVSLSYGKKLRGQLQRTGQMERVEQRRGTARKLFDEARGQLRHWLIAVPDLTLDQLQQKLDEDCGVKISRAQVARALKRMGLRLKKSHSTPPSATGKKTAVGVKSFSSVSARSRRKS